MTLPAALTSLSWAMLRVLENCTCDSSTVVKRSVWVRAAGSGWALAAGSRTAPVVPPAAAVTRGEGRGRGGRRRLGTGRRQQDRSGGADGGRRDEGGE